MATGHLLLIPASLGECPWEHYLPPAVRQQVLELDYFIAENARSARAELKRLGIARPLQEIEIRQLPENLQAADIDSLLEAPASGRSAGLLSEAGCPGVADPGAQVVRAAHERGLRVVPLVGPSSILLALMASGLDGQRFAFHGYLPIKEPQRREAIRKLEDESRRERRTQIFIEAPYRNDALFTALLEHCRPTTRLAVAANLTLAGETIRSHTVGQWRKLPPPDLNRQPTVFVLSAS